MSIIKIIFYCAAFLNFQQLVAVTIGLDVFRSGESFGVLSVPEDETWIATTTFFDSSRSEFRNFFNPTGFFKFRTALGSNVYLVLHKTLTEYEWFQDERKGFSRIKSGIVLVSDEDNFVRNIKTPSTLFGALRAYLSRLEWPGGCPNLHIAENFYMKLVPSDLEDVSCAPTRSMRVPLRCLLFDEEVGPYLSDEDLLCEMRAYIKANFNPQCNPDPTNIL